MLTIRLFQRNCKSVKTLGLVSPDGGVPIVLPRRLEDAFQHLEAVESACGVHPGASMRWKTNHRIPGCSMKAKVLFSFTLRWIRSSFPPVRS